MGKKNEWAFKGTVTSLNIKGYGPPASHQCLFTLKAGKGASEAFLLEPFESPDRYLAMLQVLTMAFDRGSQIAVNTLPGHEPPYVYEIEARTP